MGNNQSRDDSSQRAGLIFHDVRKRDLKPGDHIYSYRGVPPLLCYSHHGIYIGERDCEVIHFDAPPGGTKCRSSATIRSCSLSSFLDGNQLRLVSYDEPFLFKVLKKSESSHCIESRPAEDVISTAKYYLNNPHMWDDYSAYDNNCESFAFYCKTELPDFTGQGARLKGLNVPKAIGADLFEAVYSQGQKLNRILDEDSD